jgi:hypothetical protein
MPHPPTPHDRRAGSRNTAIWLLLISAALVTAAPVSRAAEPATAAPQPSVTTETPAAGAGPLTPVHREPSAPAQSTLSSKQTPAAKKPAITMPTPAATPSADAAAPAPMPPAAKPQPKQAETATPSSPTPKAAKPPVAQAEEATPPRPHRKAPTTRSASTAANATERAMPADRRATVVERRERTVDVNPGPRRERVYREEYGWPEDAPFAERRAAPYPPPPVYGDAGGEMGPAPFAPPWYYRNRALAWGPYPGMGYPGPGRW